MFAQVYECSNCGDVWDVYPYDHIDTDRDKIETLIHCSVCNNAVMIKMRNNCPVMHPLTPDEIDGIMQDFDI